MTNTLVTTQSRDYHACSQCDGKSEVELEKLGGFLKTVPWLVSSTISLLPVRSSPRRTLQPSVKLLIACFPLVPNGDGAHEGTTANWNGRDTRSTQQTTAGISLAISATIFSVELPLA